MPALPPVKKFVSSTGVRIYQIPCQVFEALSASVYLLLGAGLPTLVDVGSGLGDSTRQILAGLEAVHSAFGEPIRVGDIGRIIVSHGHSDHIGGLADLLKHAAAEVAVHALDSWAIASHREHVVLSNSRLDAFFERAGVDPARRAAMLKMSRYSGRQIEGVAIGLNLTDGQQLDGLRIIHTPGHSPGHVCIGVGDVLLSADHILARTVPQQWPESTAAHTGLGHYLESLDKIAKLPGVKLTLAAHEQLIHDVYGRIEAIRAAHVRRLDRLLDTLNRVARPLSVDEITRHLYPEVTGFRAVLAVTDVGSRVEYMHQRGRLVVANLDQVQSEERTVHQYRLVPRGRQVSCALA
jgi:glyoxylase-like metal-dependent hydrolase (beta-lactamase superfamily II)